MVETMLEAIRSADPGRLVLCDGAEWGRKPIEAFLPMRVAMMTRGYDPFQLTHFNDYEDYHGHQLDRQLLELLQRY